MNRVPKPPIGFVPVDSEEARTIDGDVWVNYAFTATKGWIYGNNNMSNVRQWQRDSPAHYHVQLPPPVEWEEVWGWGKDIEGRPALTYKGEFVERFITRRFTDDVMDTIVRALNEMEGQ